MAIKRRGKTAIEDENDMFKDPDEIAPGWYLTEAQEKRALTGFGLGLSVERVAEMTGIKPKRLKYYLNCGKNGRDEKTIDFYHSALRVRAEQEGRYLSTLMKAATGETKSVQKETIYKYSKDKDGNLEFDEKGDFVLIPEKQIIRESFHPPDTKVIFAQLASMYPEKYGKDPIGVGEIVRSDKTDMNARFGVLVVPGMCESEDEWAKKAFEQQRKLEQENKENPIS